MMRARLRVCGLACGWLLAGIPCSAHAPVVDVVFVGRGQSFHQQPDGQLVGASGALEGVADRTLTAGASFLGGDVAAVWLAGPGLEGEVAIPRFEGNPLDYEFERGYADAGAFAPIAAGGTWRISWQEPAGERVTVPLELAPLAPLSPTRLLRPQAGVRIDPRGAVEISWEAFGDVGGEQAFIEVEISYWTGSERTVIWSSDEDEEGEGDEDALGLPADTTRIRIPPMTFTQNPAGAYEVSVWFARVDWIEPLELAFGAMKGAVTTVETLFSIEAINPWAMPDRINLPPGGHYRSDRYGWIWGLDAQWGRCTSLGLMNVWFTPDYLFLPACGWLIPLDGDLHSGLWALRPPADWLYLTDRAPGWCYRAGAGWTRLPGL